MNGAVPWYQSRSVMGAIAAIIMTIATQFHLLPASVTQDQVVSFLLMAIPMGVALEGRISATKVVTTPAKAAAINAAAAPTRMTFEEARREALDLFHFPHLPAPEAPVDPAKASPVISMEKPMSSIIVEIEDDVLTFLKSAGKAVEAFALSETQKLVAEVKATYVGTVALNVVQALESQSMDVGEKFAAVVSAVTPLIEKLIATGGISGAIASVESFAREVAQSTYNDFKADLAKIAGSTIAAGSITQSQAA